jgi:hypothetical protein
MKQIPIAILVAMLAVGCASGPQRVRSDDTLAQYLDYTGEPVRSFTAFRLQSWQPLARNRLILWTGVNEAYLVTVWDSCPDLQFANSIGVTSTGSQVTTFDHVRVGRDRCPIQAIRPIDVRQMKTDRAALAKPREE